MSDQPCLEDIFWTWKVFVKFLSWAEISGTPLFSLPILLVVSKNCWQLQFKFLTSGSQVWTQWMILSSFQEWRFLFRWNKPLFWFFFLKRKNISLRRLKVAILKWLIPLANSSELWPIPVIFNVHNVLRNDWFYKRESAISKLPLLAV